MKSIEISAFADQGNLNKERIVLRAQFDVKIGEYAILRAKKGKNGSATAGNRTAYWFPDKEVKLGDLVVLYTKAGTSSFKDLSDGRTAHFFYWGIKAPIWSDDTYGAALLRVAEWTFKIPVVAPSDDE